MHFFEESGHLAWMMCENGIPISTPSRWASLCYPTRAYYKLLMGLLRLSTLCFLRRNTDAFGGKILAVPLSRASRCARTKSPPPAIAEGDFEWMRLHGVTVALEG
jgi:hypothetical protein